VRWTENPVGDGREKRRLKKKIQNHVEGGMLEGGLRPRKITLKSPMSNSRKQEGKERLLGLSAWKEPFDAGPGILKKGGSIMGPG